ncbi:PREDICTED: uncharacterized protein LOC109223268 [Nicotiana attenuata]|uniref:Uncharacterized protein n=1 Tax=Nicotiana attenuata TaxID=49451 RepID=A0A1J6IHK0_NICAT|nr:PREDICTED: uncharacterized protein LOC109223268 [Nicotiana attenuata]OIT04350.1 hypothetical protein A4A49_09572 [Nicotiana attenuata]
MGTSCLCSSLYRFPVDYPDCTVRLSYGYAYSSGPKRLQAATATGTVTGDDICQDKRTCLFSAMRVQKPIITAAILAAAAACAMIMAVNGAEAAEQLTQQEINGETFSNVPQTLSGECVEGQKDCKKARIQRPKSRQAETCTVKCVNTCIRGGLGSPGEGPLNVRRPLVVFKQGFRSRQYCLVECSDICNLIRDGEDGP